MMRQRKVKRTGPIVNNTGYKDDSPTEDNPFNIIPGKNITMRDTKDNIIGIGLDKEGKMASMKFMKPDQEYDFLKANAVLEIPQYQKGGKSDWISNKISLLIKEGKPKDQAIAIAYSMYDKNFQNGGGFFNSPLEQTNIQRDAQRGKSPFDVNLNLDPFNLPDYGAAPQQYQGFEMPSFDSIMNPTNIPSNGTTPPQGGNPVPSDTDLTNFKQDQNMQEQTQFANSLPTDNTTLDLNKANAQINEEDQANSRRLDPNPTYQFFNPYNGVDIPTAASALGSSIEGKNTLGIIGASTKLATGLGRGIVGGIGQERANQYAVDEYNKRQRADLTQSSYLQAGGNLNDQDVKNINNEIEGIDFNPDVIRNLFEKVQTKQPTTDYTPNYGRYNDLGYFDLQTMDGDNITLRTTDKNPHNSEDYRKLLPYLQEQNPGKNVSLNFTPKLQKGGELTQEQILSGEYSGEDAGATNAEVETGEYRNDGQGNVTEVVGDSHEQGGVDVTLQEGERILSDHTKIGGDTASMFRKDFELEVKAGDTYATILDKFKKKSGLDKIAKELEDLSKKVDIETKKKDSTSKEMNLEFLSKKINELTEKKKPLDSAKEMLFDKVYGIQESKKPKEEQAEGNEFQSGGQMFNDDQVVEYAKQFNIEPDRAKELIAKLQSGGQFGPKGMAKSLPEGQHLDSSTSLYGGITEQQLAETKLRNPWFDWSNFDPSRPGDILRFQQEYNQRATEGKQIKPDDKFGIQTQSAQLPYTNMQGPVPPNTEINAPLLLQEIQQKVNNNIPLTEEEKSQAKGLGMLLLPDQSPLPPSALQPVLKNQRRYGRIDPTLIDPTQQLGEIARQESSAQTAINQRPDSSRAAVLAQVAANTQNATSKAMAQVNQANQRAQTQADAFNIRQGDREQDAAAQDALSYEQRMFMGMSNTENDIRDYFQSLQNINLANKRTVDDINLVNAMNDNFQFDGTGFVQTGKPMTLEEMENRIRRAQGVGNDTTTTKKKKLLRGGRKKKR